MMSGGHHLIEQTRSALGVVLSPLTIHGKLILALGLQLALLLGVALLTLFGLHRVQRSFEAAIGHGLTVERLAGDMRNELGEARRAEKDLLLGQPEDGFTASSQRYSALNRQHVARIRQLIAELDRAATDRMSGTESRIKDDLVALTPYVNVYAEDFDAVVTLIGEHAPRDRIAVKTEDFQSAALVVEPLVADIALTGQRAAAAEIAAARAAGRRTAFLVGGCVVAAVLTGLGLAYKLSRLITAPLEQLARTAEVIGAGDLTVHVPVGGRDEIATLAATFNDMTGRLRALIGALEQRVLERERAEEQVRRLNAGLEERVRERTAELESSNRDLEAFCYSVSHDLRSPLRHISGYVYLLSHGSLARERDAEQYLRQTADAVKRMEQLIDALLVFSRIGYAELRMSEVSLANLVAEARAEIEHEAAGRRVAFTVGPLASVQADRTLLKQVVLNLLSNALKFTRTRPIAEIEIRAAPELARPGENVFLVRDNGVGFDMAYRHKLFGVFQRLHREQQFEGTGIGLANVDRIIRRHGGRVWAEAQPDRGATFFVGLRAAAQKAA
jgi:signal transduction histidine kinase